ncbi:hypothetical protein J43TS3_28800 [Ornithinibacillus bavariensis]|uniref:Uncharacterized protein n=1 Tax=Ornithinibacillus bavariensis TaxID=545502 RepID=A0A920C8I9_9BACI|nr:hypothetical protein J43TS3_28800 [Ornithinibacillus bavariensis]
MANEIWGHRFYGWKRNTPTVERVWRIAMALDMPLKLLITRLKFKEEGGNMSKEGSKKQFIQSLY